MEPGCGCRRSDAPGCAWSRERIRAPPRLPGSHCRMRADPSLACSPAPSLAPGGQLGFPLTRAWGLRQPRVEGRGKEVRCGVGEGEEKGRRGRPRLPMTRGSVEGHLSSRPLSRPPRRPPPRPSRGWGGAGHLGRTSVRTLGLEPRLSLFPSRTPSLTLDAWSLGQISPP